MSYDPLVRGIFCHSKSGYHKWIWAQAPTTIAHARDWYLWMPFSYDLNPNDNVIHIPLSYFKKAIDEQTKLGYECRPIY